MADPKSLRVLLNDLGMSRNDILSLDPRLFSEKQKQAYIEVLYGPSEKVSWKHDLVAVARNLRRWDRLLASDTARGSPYRVGQEHLRYLAQSLPPKHVGTTVSDFTDWIYRLYVPQKDYASLLRGRRIEREIARRRIPVPMHPRWKLVFNGMVEDSSDVYSISQLSIGGVPMRGRPDLVFREKGSRMLIVEVKTSEAEIPSDGWPNLRAQLWAYSMIDNWRDVDDILLVGEVWGFVGGIRLRQTLHWQKSDLTLEEEGTTLFRMYRDYCEAL